MEREIVFESEKLIVYQDGSYKVKKLDGNRSLLQLATFLDDRDAIEFAFSQSEPVEAVRKGDGPLGIFFPPSHEECVELCKRKMEDKDISTGWIAIFALTTYKLAIEQRLRDLTLSVEDLFQSLKNVSDISFAVNALAQVKLAKEKITSDTQDKQEEIGKEINAGETRGKKTESSNTSNACSYVDPMDDVD